RQTLRRAGGEAHVSKTSPARVLFRCGDGFWVGINPINSFCQRSYADRQAAVATPEVQDALPAHERRSAPLPELVVRTRPESGRISGNVPADVVERARCDSPHRCAA